MTVRFKGNNVLQEYAFSLLPLENQNYNNPVTNRLLNFALSLDEKNTVSEAIEKLNRLIANNESFTW